ncbi:MAG: hypothetical protein M3N52_01285, partial [Actinomycetota bacterium]|nr:hypothetical protein [Actinomycetota bacterium]
MAQRTTAPDPWRSAPVGELHDPLLPRWFVVTALVTVPLAIAAFVAAFVAFRPTQIPVAERRPPPQGPLTNAVGAWQVGDSDPVSYDQACPLLRGTRVAGDEADQGVLRIGLAALCNTDLEHPTRAALEWFAGSGGTVRFAVFAVTGVDSTATLSTLEGPPGSGELEGPLILVNAKFARTDPLWVAPLVAHDAVLLHQDRLQGSAEGALTARRAEVEVCRRLLSDRRPSRGCRDAEALLALPDPLGALRAAG